MDDDDEWSAIMALSGRVSFAGREMPFAGFSEPSISEEEEYSDRRYQGFYPEQYSKENPLPPIPGEYNPGKIRRAVFCEVNGTWRQDLEVDDNEVISLQMDWQFKTTQKLKWVCISYQDAAPPGFVSFPETWVFSYHHYGIDIMNKNVKIDCWDICPGGYRIKSW